MEFIWARGSASTPNPDAIQLLILVVLLALSAFFSSSETALTTVNKIRMRTLADAGDGRAEFVMKVISNPGKMLSAILIGNNIVNLYASSLSTMLATRLWGNEAVGFATGVLTLLILVFGEITPKTVSTISAESIALCFAKIIYYNDSFDTGDLHRKPSIFFCPQIVPC